jgi:hypothetical protein
MDKSQIIEAEVVDAPSQVKNTKRPFWKSFRFWKFIILLTLFIGSIVWAINAVSTYQNAKKYKEAYDIVQQQLEKCVNPKAEDGKPITVTVNYCNEFNTRFDAIEKEVQK